MRRSAAALTALLALSSCADQPAAHNPFLDDGSGGKEDSGYVNLRGVELEVTLEADVEAPSYQIFKAPAELAQFAVTYLREEETFYLEILGEDATAPERVEWLVDGTWLTNDQAQTVDKAKLTHFRMRQVNAVVMNYQATGVTAGKTYTAIVPRKPYSIMSDAGKKCANSDDHITLDQSVYWYRWEPNGECPAELVQNMSVVVDAVLPRNPETYPEYDQLLADQRLDVVVLWGKLDDGKVSEDGNWENVESLSRYLKQAGFVQQNDAPLGRRFQKQVGEITEVVDIYGPDLFASVADYAGMANWQKAVSEHEVVMYNGHSVLGTGYAFEEVTYPDFYQIFSVASCLSYEYYVRPVLAGKKSWDKVDVLSNVEPTYYSENLPLVSAMLAKLFWGAEHNGQASWQDIMQAVSKELGHARFGVSGARTNCFSPTGNRCQEEPAPTGAASYENSDVVAIPDASAGAVTSTIEVTDAATIATLKVDLDITHTYVGDLVVTLSHDGVVATLWDRSGGSDDNLQMVLPVDAFAGKDAQGAWTLSVQDNAAEDTGTLNRWALTITQ